MVYLHGRHFQLAAATGQFKEGSTLRVSLWSYAKSIGLRLIHQIYRAFRETFADHASIRFWDCWYCKFCSRFDTLRAKSFSGSPVYWWVSFRISLYSEGLLVECSLLWIVLSLLPVGKCLPCNKTISSFPCATRPTWSSISARNRAVYAPRENPNI